MLRLPRTAQSRSACTFVKLLERVLPHARHGGFEGRVLKAGSNVDPALLPEPCLLLECAPTGGRGHNARWTWILWKLDRSRLTWREVARSDAEGDTWTIALRPIALYELNGGRPEPAVDVPAIARRVTDLLDRELAAVEPSIRAEVLSALEPEFAGRWAEWVG
jgi:hypothetical protein